MAVDRGGLQYTIAIRDQFSKTTAKFRTELESAKAAFKDLQQASVSQRGAADSFKKTAAAVDENKAALQRLQAESKRQQAVEREAVKIRTTQARDSARNAADQARQQRDAAQAAAQQQRAEQQAIQANIRAKASAEREAAKISRAARADEAAALLKQQRDVKAAADSKTKAEREASKISASLRKDEQAQLKAFADQQASTEREAAKIAAAQARDARARQAQDPNFLAQQRINDSLREEAIVRAQITQLRARAQQQFAAGDLLGGAKSINQAKDLKESLRDVGSSASQTLFTFRRLVGILAVFTIARETVQGFKNLVSSALQFSNVIDSARVGIAGLIVATAEVRDQFGRPVQGAQAFAIAVQVADQQVRQLQKDAIALGVPFESLVETFQIAVAPGFGAGLNINQIRQLTGSIAAAAKAIGLPQNQLAEEIRSLLAGTIQARTTRIATALGITNADVKRLKETGQLFDFLEKKFASFNEAAQRQARSTLSGLQEVVHGVVNQILGEAARPLFEALVRVGNELLDRVLTVRDAAGKIRVNPQVVQSFRAIFVALEEGVVALRDAFKDLGFGGLRDALAAVGAALVSSLKFAIGFAETLLRILTAVVGAVCAVGNFLGIGEKGLGQIAGALGTIVGLTVVWNNTLGLTGLRVGTIVTFLVDNLIAKFPQLPAGMKALGKEAAIVAGILALAVGAFDLILGSIFDVNLNLAETVKLIGLGLVGGIESAALALKKVANQFKGAFTLQTQEQIDAENARAVEQSKQRQLDIDKQIADVTTKAAERSNRGPGFDPFAKAKKNAQDFQGILSGVGRQVKELDALIKSIDDETFKAGREFSVAFNSKDVEGSAKQIQSIFSESLVKSAVDLKKIRSDQARVEQEIADIVKAQNVDVARRAQLESVADGALSDQQVKALKISEAEAQLVSLFQDQRELQQALAAIAEKNLELALKKAAVVALESSRTLSRENVLLAQQAENERAITDVVVRRLGARQQAVVEAQNALNLARVESAQQQQALERQIAVAREAFLAANRTGPGGPTAAERSALLDNLTALEQRLEIEKAISGEKEKQLEKQRQEAELVIHGSLGQGVERGFQDLAKELPTAFEAGIAIVKQSTQALADFISTSIVTAFDPTQDQSLQERFARFLQGIANIILQQIVSLAISSAIQQALGQTEAGAITVGAATTAAGITVTAAETAGAIEVANATAAAAIRAASGAGLGFHEGGYVPRGFARGGVVGSAMRAASAARVAVQGLASGGRPAGIHPLDTVPAWLQPGEFVVRKAVVDSLGLGFFNSVNQGAAPALPSAPSGAGAGEAAGMARGGLVTDRLERRAAADQKAGGRDLVVLPVQVAGEKEYDKLQAGGKNAFIRNIRENATTIRGILQGGK